MIGNSGDVPVAACKAACTCTKAIRPRDVVFPVRALGRLGIKAAILTNAAGGINHDLHPGRAGRASSDHINLQGVKSADRRQRRALRPALPRYDARPTSAPIARSRSSKETPRHRRSSKVCTPPLRGPMYETPAEIRFLRTIGADVVGMSTVAEVIAARHLGMRVLAISCVTNMAAGILDQPISTGSARNRGAREAHFVALLRGVIPHRGRCGVGSAA